MSRLTAASCGINVPVNGRLQLLRNYVVEIRIESKSKTCYCSDELLHGNTLDA